MSRVVICDRCGKKVGNLDLEALGYSSIKVGGEVYDICPECKKKFDEFIKEGHAYRSNFEIPKCLADLKEKCKNIDKTERSFG